MIGRILYLKNNHIPPKDTDLSCPYLAFGYYDGIDISENLYKSGEAELVKLWFRSVEDTIGLTGGYSSQAMYLFRDAEDAYFWEDKELPFLFIVMLQLEDKSVGLKLIRETLEKKLKEGMKNRGSAKLKICSYLTLDGNDVVLALKSNDYKVGMQVAESFHTEGNALEFSGKTVKISYSFTVSGIWADFDKALPLITGKPDICHIHIVEKEPGTAKKLIEKVKALTGKQDEIRNYMILGRDDELVEFEPDSWEEILKLYREDGVFYNHKEYRDCALNVSSRFLYKDLKNCFSFGSGGVSPEKKEVKTICQNLKDTLKDRFQELVKEEAKPAGTVSKGGKGRKSQKQLEYYKAIWQVLNSIEKFEYAIFPDYIYVSIYAPLQMLVGKITALEDESDLEGDGEDEKLINQKTIEGIYEFLTAINQISQNLIKADRQFMQTPELNAGCYHAPVKINAYYAAFAEKVKRFLNVGYGKGNRYEFMLYPGLNEQLRVKRVFSYHGDQKRLMLVEIPEKQMFEPKYIMITLSHEIAHFVGSDLRMRKKRYKILIRAVSRMMATYAYLSGDLQEFITEEGLKTLQKDLEVHIEEYVKAEIYVYQQKNPERKDYVYHADYFKAILLNSVNNFLGDCIGNQKIVFEKLFKYYIEENAVSGKNTSEWIESLVEKRDNFLTAEAKFIYSMQRFVVRDIKEGDTQVSTYTMIDLLFSILKESFADLASILMLNLPYEEYFKSILHNNSYYSVEALMNTDAMIRVAIVAEAMNARPKALENEKDVLYWTFRKPKQEKTDLEKLETKVIGYHNLMSKRMSNFETFNGKQDPPMLEALADSELLNMLAEYLLACRVWFVQKRKNGADDLLKGLRENFSTITRNYQVEKQIMYIDTAVQDYRKDIMEYCKKNEGKTDDEKGEAGAGENNLS